MSGRVTAAELLQAVGDAGYEISTSQLKRLRRAGLLPQPDQQHPVGLRGSLTLYPEWAIDQLLGLLALRREVRSLNQLVFWAWWEGLWVDRRTLRNNLLHWAAPGLQQLSRIIASHADPADAADEIWRELGLSAHSAPRFVQHRVGPRYAGTATFLLVQLMAGARLDWVGEGAADTGPLSDPTPDQIMFRATGLQQATAPTPAPGDTIRALVEEPPPVDQLYEDLQDSGMLDPGNWLHAMKTAAVPELNEARALAQAILVDLPFLAQAARYGGADATDPLGFGNLIHRNSRDRATLRRFASFVPLALLMRRNGSSADIAESVDALAEATATIRQALEDLGLESVPDPP